MPFYIGYTLTNAIYIYNNKWSREKLKLEFLILILCHVSRFILLIFQFKFEIGVQFCSIFTMLTLDSPPLLEICFTFKCCAFFSFFFWLNKTFCSSLNIWHAYLQVHLPFCQSQQQQQHNLHLLDLRHQILLWQRPSSPMAPVCLSLSLSLFVGSSFNGFKKWDCLAFCIYRGIKKMKDSLPTQVLNEKLPRFL